MTNLYKALAAFQQEVPIIHKATKGYGYSYSDLPTIFQEINPLLKKHKLGFSQLVQGDSIKTIVFHWESGETIDSVTNIPQNVTLKGMNEYQVLGSAITYIRRYALSSILGLVTDKDTDASGEQIKKTPTPKRQKIKEPANKGGWEERKDGVTKFLKSKVDNVNKTHTLTSEFIELIKKAMKLCDNDDEFKLLLIDVGYDDVSVANILKSKDAS